MKYNYLIADLVNIKYNPLNCFSISHGDVASERSQCGPVTNATEYSDLLATTDTKLRNLSDLILAQCPESLEKAEL